MTFPLLAPGLLVSSRSGRYRGFEVSAERASDGSDTERCYAMVTLPTAMPRMTVRYERWGKYGPLTRILRGVSVGYPPFDRLFGVYGDHRFVRAAITSDFVSWMMSVDWTAVKSQLSFRNTIVFGETRFGPASIAADLDDQITPPQIQGMLDLLIDFLYHLPREIWPIPLPPPVART